MSKVYWWGSVVIASGTFLATCAVYSRLPEVVPIHFDLQFRPDAWGSRAWIFTMPAFMLGFIALFPILDWFAPAKFKVDSFRETALHIWFLVEGLFAFLQAMIVCATLELPIDGGRWMCGGFMVFFILCGNLMGKIRRNPYIGVRVPWTLASERVWNDTHRFAAGLFVLCGVIGLVLVLAGASPVYAFAQILIAAFGPIVFSFALYKKLEREGRLATEE
jgi:uncharacterized membrane protein